MSYKLTEREYHSALKLNADYRYHYFLKKVQEGLELFVLKNDDGVLFMETENEGGAGDGDDNVNVIPVWCHEAYAKYYAEQNEDVKDYEVQAISLAVFIEKWVENLNGSGIELAVFPLSNTDCNIVTPQEMVDDLKLDEGNAPA